jgi:hypothetical protein
LVAERRKMNRFLFVAVAALALAAPATAEGLLDEEDEAVIAEYCVGRYGGDLAIEADCRRKQAKALNSIFGMYTAWGRNPRGQAKLETEIMARCRRERGADFVAAIDCFVEGATENALRKQGLR